MTLNEIMTAAGEPGKPYSIEHELRWAENEINRLNAAIDLLHTGLHSHGWRNTGPRYHEEGYDVGDGDDCGDSGLSVGMQAETGYIPPETVEQRLRRKDFLYLAKVERNE